MTFALIVDFLEFDRRLFWIMLTNHSGFTCLLDLITLLDLLDIRLDHDGHRLDCFGHGLTTKLFDLLDQDE